MPTAPTTFDEQAPYFAVIFTTTQSSDLAGYEETAGRMEALAATYDGFLGIDSARSDIGITVSYWRDESSIAAWKADAEHTLARETGRERWYERYTLRVARVEREYAWVRT